MAFDLDSPPVPDSVVADIAAAIRNDGKLPPLSDEEKNRRRIDHEIYLAQRRERDEERRMEYEQHQALERENARREAASAAAQARAKATAEYNQRANDRQHDSELLSLKIQQSQQRGWMNAVESATRNSIAYRERTTLLNELENMLTPPQPPPEPIVNQSDDDCLGSPNIADDNFNPGYWLQKPIFRR